ncbi:MAG: ATP-binding cassette domain-containing protein [Synergistes sp.]|nr:ATP-binding cassette domain-containing protein [Synergistes sp.]
MSVTVEFRKKLGSFSLDVSFEAGDEVLALLGGSGCGKSMTLKCIAGIVSPDEGRIIVNGVTFYDSAARINLKPQQRHVGLLFQNYALFPNMTVRKNIMTVFEHGAGRKEDKEKKYKEIAERFFIKGLEDHHPSQLSGGQQQRVALARIMASDPAVIMLDEPLSALDSFLHWRLEQKLARLLHEFRGTTLYVSHNRDEVYRLCSRVCVINQGMSEPVKSISEFFEAPPTLTAAILSGCKNFSRAEATGERTLFAKDWNMEFRCAHVLPKDIRYAGVRAHYLIPVAGDERGENTIEADILEVSDDVFSGIITVRPRGADPQSNFSVLRVEVSKETASRYRGRKTIYLSVAPKNVMPLFA